MNIFLSWWWEEDPYSMLLPFNWAIFIREATQETVFECFWSEHTLFYKKNRKWYDFVWCCAKNCNDFHGSTLWISKNWRRAHVLFFYAPMRSANFTTTGLFVHIKRNRVKRYTTGVIFNWSINYFKTSSFLRKSKILSLKCRCTRMQLVVCLACGEFI